MIHKGLVVVEKTQEIYKKWHVADMRMAGCFAALSGFVRFIHSWLNYTSYSMQQQQQHHQSSLT